MTKPSDTAAGDEADTAAATRKAKGSVHEAIGKLIGDDAVRDVGTAAKKAATPAKKKPPQV